jgi:hypothetical protein
MCFAPEVFMIRLEQIRRAQESRLGHMTRGKVPELPIPTPALRTLAKRLQRASWRPPGWRGGLPS